MLPQVKTSKRRQILSGTCAKSIVAGVHFGEVSVDGGALGRVVCAVQAAVTDGVEIAAVLGRDKTRGDGRVERKDREPP